MVELEVLVSVESHDRETVAATHAELAGQAIDQTARPVPVLAEGGRELPIDNRGRVAQPLDGREQKAVVDQLLHDVAQERRTTKYLAWGWWQTMAAVVCSGWNCQDVSSLTSTPMRSAPTSSAHLALSSRSGHAS